MPSTRRQTRQTGGDRQDAFQHAVETNNLEDVQALLNDPEVDPSYDTQMPNNLSTHVCIHFQYCIQTITQYNKIFLLFVSLLFPPLSPRLLGLRVPS